jgi:hypothetical protein
LSNPIANVNFVSVKPLACDCRADVGLALMVRSYDLDRFAEHFAAEVFDGHTGCDDVARAAKIGVDPG